MMFLFTQSSQPNEIIQENTKQEEREHMWKKALSFRLGGPSSTQLFGNPNNERTSDTLQEPRQY